MCQPSCKRHVTVNTLFYCIISAIVVDALTIRQFKQVGRIDGVVWLKWLKTGLEKQVRYGSRIGQIDFEKARMELELFCDHESYLVDYFSVNNLLHPVSAGS